MIALIYLSGGLAGVMAAGFVALAFMDSATVLDLAKSVAGQGATVTYSAARHQHMFIPYLAFSGLLLAYSVFMVAMREKVLRQWSVISADALLVLIDMRQSARHHFRVDVVGVSLLVVFMVGTALRLAYINADMTYDEADIFFMGKDPIFLALTSLRTSLHNLPILATAASTALFGSAEWAVRLPYLIFGLALMPAVFWCGAVLFDRWAGLIAAALAAIAWPLVAYSIAARGYISGTLAFVLILAVIPYLIRTGNRAALLLVGLLSVLAGFSVQSMVFGYIAAMAFLAMGILGSEGGGRWKRLLVWPIMISGVTILGLMVLMSPLLLAHGAKGLATGDHLVGQAGLSAWEILKGQVLLVAAEWRLDLPMPLIAVLALGFAAGLWSHGTARVLFISLLIGVSPALVLVGEQLPPSRMWQFLLPPCAMISGVGLVWLGRRVTLPAFGRQAASALVLVSMGWVFVSALRSENIITQFVGREPHESNTGTRAFARDLVEGDYVSRQVLADPILRYYVYQEFVGRDLMFIDDRTYIHVCSRSRGCRNTDGGSYYFSAKFTEPPSPLAIQPGSVRETGHSLHEERPLLKGLLVPPPSGGSGR